MLISDYLRCPLLCTSINKYTVVILVITVTVKLLSVQIALTLRLYPGPSVYPGPGFYQIILKMLIFCGQHELTYDSYCVRSTLLGISPSEKIECLLRINDVWNNGNASIMMSF